MNRLKDFFWRTPEADSMLLASWDAASQVDANFQYYSGLTIDRATFIAKRDSEPVLLLSPLNAALAKAEFKGEISVFQPGEYRKLLSTHLTGCRKLAIAKSSITATLYDNVKKATKARIYDASNDFVLQRATKSAAEISLVKRACQIAHKAFKDLYVRPGKSEDELTHELSALLYELGAEPSFRPIIGFGSNSRFPHFDGTSRRLKRNEIILVDWGAKFKGYCSDHTRCVFFGSPPNEQEKAYEKVEQIFDSLLPLIKPGISSKKLSQHYHKLLTDAELPLPPHGLGHGIGLDVHEYPSFTRNSKDEVTANSTLAIEPAAYFKDFGVRYEETIVVKRSAKVL